MPLITEFQFTREIEDRRWRPWTSGGWRSRKIAAGMVQALVAGLVVIPAAGVAALGSGVQLSSSGRWSSRWSALLVAMFSAAGGLALGCSIGQTADRPDVQFGDRAHDDVRVRVLSVERAR